VREEYTTIHAPAQDEFVEKRSRFIGHICPVTGEEEALEFIRAKKSEYWDASHNVYAYVLREGRIQRYSDDSEPQGTAGIPVLEVLLKEGVVDVVVVVTRYFGGTLLGAGGLVRAYSHGAKIALDAAQKKCMSWCGVLEMQMDYSLYGRIANLLPNYRAQVLESDFGALVRLRVLIKQSLIERFRKELCELTSDLVTAEMVEEQYAEGKE
jgi:uncharacterized YigZ family protein